MAGTVLAVSTAAKTHKTVLANSEKIRITDDDLTSKYFLPQDLANWLAVNTMAAGTLTTSQPQLLTQTWNAGAVVFSGRKTAITATAAAANSLFDEITVGGSTVFGVGALSSNGVNATIWLGQATPSTSNYVLLSISGTTYLNAASLVHLRVSNNSVLVADSTQLSLPSTALLGWSSTGDPTATRDLFMRRVGAATFGFGAADAAAPVAQTFQMQSVVAGTSNTSGADATWNLSKGTGTGAGGGGVFMSAKAGTTGSTQNTLAEAFRILGTGAGVRMSGGGVTVANLPAAVQGGMAFVTDASTTLILGLGLTVTGGGANKVPVYSDGTNWIIG